MGTRDSEMADEAEVCLKTTNFEKCKIPKIFRATLAPAACNRLNYWREAAREARRLTPVIEKGRRASRFN